MNSHLPKSLDGWRAFARGLGRLVISGRVGSGAERLVTGLPSAVRSGAGPRRGSGLTAALWAVALAGCGMAALLCPIGAYALPLAVPTIDWKPCSVPARQGFDCATARVPLDYSKPDDRTIELALIRHKATDPAHRIGTLFFNPGGPGGRGTVILPMYLDLPAAGAPVIFPELVRERFDIVSWDPRGVGASTSVQCFATPQAEKDVISRLAVGLPTTWEDRMAWIRGWEAIARVCSRSQSAWLLPHVSTTDTARDLDLLRQAVGDSQLSYQGNSYGTLLGAVYANLFPDKVRAMVLLGNDEPVGYTNAGADRATFDTSLRQNVDRGTADTLEAFLQRCGQATTRQCPFSAGSGPATKAKWQSLLRRIRKTPIIAGGVTYNYDLVVTLTVVSLYELKPGFIGFDWGWLATMLQAVWEGSTDPNRYPPFPGSPGGQVATQLLAVFCGESPTPRDPNAYFALSALSQYRSGDVGPYWVWRDEECAAWPVVAADRYTGPWNRRTAHPILIVNNSHDPATPYSEAVSMAAELADTRLLKIDGYGHADAAVASTCADGYVSRYFIDGTLPPIGTVCRQDSLPFAVR